MLIQNSFSIECIICILNYALAAMTPKFIFVTFNITFTMNYVIYSNLRLPTVCHHATTYFLNF